MFDTLRNLPHRLRRAFRRAEFERQLDDELRFHVDAEEADLVRRGVAPHEARRRARAALGGFDRWRDEARDTRASRPLENVARDLRLALRALRRAPSYTVPAVATLALGVGAMATIGSLAYDVLLRPLPYDQPSRLVAIYERNVPRQVERNVVSGLAFLAWREGMRTVDSVSALMPDTEVWLTDAGPERVSGAMVSPGLFELLGRKPMLGAGFSFPAGASEVILSHGFWTRRLGADASIVGKAVRFGAKPLTVVGVMPPDFVPLRLGWLGADQEYWRPLTVTQEQAQQWGRFLLVAARLRPGVTLEAAAREFEATHASLRSERVLSDGWYPQVIPLAEEISGSVRPALSALVVACLLLLVMVLTNTTLLTIAHARRRAADRVLRTVLGATRARLAGERLITTLILALTGSSVGVAASAWAIPALTRFLPPDVPLLDTVRFGSAALLVGAITALLATLVLTVAPMIDHRGSAMPATLQGGARLTRGAHTASVVVGEAALAVVLTILAVLTLRSFERLTSVDVGFDPTRLLAFRVSFEAEPAAARNATRTLFEQLRALPGVVAAGRTSVRPFHSGGTATTIMPPGMGDRDRSQFPTAAVRFVDRDYFRTMGLEPIAGRLFTPADGPDAPLRVVVNEELGRKLFPDEKNVVGRQFDLRLWEPYSREIIGVVRNVQLKSPRDPPKPTVYIFAEQQSDGEQYDVLVRTSADESTLVPAIRRTVDGAARGTPIYRVERMGETVAGTIARERVTAQLLAFFAASALLLVAVGVYGLYAGDVTRRRREIGVRMALGETSAGIVRALVGRALVRTLVGVALGAGLGYATSRVLDRVLYGIPTTDPWSYLAAALLVILVALGATFVPAWQASGVQPSLALRAE